MKRFLTKNKLIVAMSISLLAPTIFYLLTPQTVRAELLYQVLQGTTGPSATIKSVWESVRSMINYIVIVALIFIAFANILRLNINTYGIKKFLPALVMGVLLANFSYLICRLVIDLASVFMSMLINSPTGGAGIGSNDYGIAGAFLVNIPDGYLITNGALNWGHVGTYLLLTLIEFAGGVLVLILALLFFIRNYMLYFLVALGPLAFMAAILPFSKMVFNQWWQNFWKWTFMPVVSLFWLWLGGRWLAPMTSGSTAGAIDGVPSISLISMLFAGACFYLAITTPKQLGQGVMTSWNNLGKWGWNKTGGQAIKSGKQAGKWVTSGGIQSSMAQRNQMLAARAKHDGKDKLADIYNARSNRWTVANPTAWSGAIKGRIAANKAAIESAPTKTSWYNTLAGPAATISANEAANIDDDKLLSPGEAGEKLRTKINKIKENLSKGAKERLKTRVESDEGQRQKTRLGYTRDEDYADHILAAEILSTNPNKLAIQYRGADMKTMGELKSVSKAYFGKMGQRYRDDAIAGFTDPVSGSPVGRAQLDQISESSQAVRGVLGQQKSDSFVRAALHGSEQFEQVAERLGGEVTAMSPGARQELQKHFEGLRKITSSMVNEELQTSQNQIEDQMIGLKMVRGKIAGATSSSAVAARLGTLSQQVAEGSTHLGQGNIEEAAKIARSMGVPINHTEEGAKEKIELTFQQVRSGVADAKTLTAAGQTLPTDNRAWANMQSQVLASKQADATRTAQATAAARLSMEGMSAQTSELASQFENISLGSGIAEGSEHIEALTQHVNELAKATSAARGAATVSYSPSQVSSILGGAAMASETGSGEPLSKVLMSKRFQESLARAIGHSVGKESAKTAQAMPSRPTVDAVSPAPIQNTTVTNNTTVEGTSDGTQPSEPFTPPPPPTNPSA